MFRINSGKYRHVVTIQKKADNQNSYGEIVDSTENWVDFFKTRVAILPISGKEVLSAEFMNSEITHRVHMRYVPNLDVDAYMRIKFGERVFQITSPPINFQERNIEWQLLCKEVL
jgi:SPP1 family predicted phage head-tail adaptor